MVTDAEEHAERAALPSDEIVEGVEIIPKEKDFPAPGEENLGRRVVRKVLFAAANPIAKSEPHAPPVSSVKRLQADRGPDRKHLVHRGKLRGQNVLGARPVLARDGDELATDSQVPRTVVANGAKVVVLEVVARVRDQEREGAGFIDVEPELVLDGVRHLSLEEELRPRKDEARIELRIARRRRLPPEQVVSELRVGADVQPKLPVATLDEEAIEVSLFETSDVMLDLLFLGDALGGRRFRGFFGAQQRSARGRELRRRRAL